MSPDTLFGGRRYYSFNRHVKQTFGCAVHKIPVDAGFTCPNRDGTLGTGGCLYCDDRGSGADAIDRSLCLMDQIRAGRERLRRRFHARKFLVYFQAFTNTYGPLDRLAALYSEALESEDIVGLSIGTRADCLPGEVMDLLLDFAARSYLWVEIGLQSSNERTLRLIRRGHGFPCFLEAARKLVDRGIRVCAHVIFGLPGEGRCEMLETVKTVKELGIQGIKFHPLHVLRGTAAEEMYIRKELEPLTLEAYVSVLADSLEILPPDVVIHRLTANRPESVLVAPHWVADKNRVIQALENEMEKRNSLQGARCAR